MRQKNTTTPQIWNCSKYKNNFNS